MKKFILFSCVLFLMQQSEAQLTRHIVRFKDKGTNPFSISNPSAYLTQTSIDRRTRYNIPIDSTDLPVTPRYVDSIRLSGAVTILNVSKWLNSVTIQTTDAAALAKINSFSFVIASQPIALKTSGSGNGRPPKNGMQSIETFPLNFFKTWSTLALYNYGLSAKQVQMHKGDFLHDIGLRGQGMIMGLLDAGYNNYLTMSSLDSARNSGQILGTWDFVAGHASVNEDNSHGSQCLSVIAANLPGQFIGTAPKASFYLFRSEDVSSEYPIEEHNWVCAAERLDSLGGDMISSSVGYNSFDDPSMDYPFSAMNGNTTISAIGADLAAKKGILVVNSAGNEGGNSWGRIITPADGDSVLAVGAVDSLLKPASFTSLGPSADGQVKPDVASMGVRTIVQFSNNAIGPNNGTSFAAPNMAGLAACLWQGFREFNNMKIIDALRKAGHKASNPNDSVGFGVPDVKLALVRLTKEFSTASATLTNCKTSINWTSKDMRAMRYEIERKLATQSNYIKVGDVAGTGNVFQTNNYLFLDSLSNATAGNISYRIRQVFDTAATSFTADYIDTVTVSLTSSCLFTSIDPVSSVTNKITLIPNPANEMVTIRVTTEFPVKELLITITSSNGQLLKRLKRSKAGGTAHFEIPVQRLAAGKYYVTVTDGEKPLATEELIKL